MINVLPPLQAPIFMPMDRTKTCNAYLKYAVCDHSAKYPGTTCPLAHSWAELKYAL